MFVVVIIDVFVDVWIIDLMVVFVNMLCIVFCKYFSEVFGYLLM